MATTTRSHVMLLFHHSSTSGGREASEGDVFIGPVAQRLGVLNQQKS